jgi:hypothetical protein
MFHAARNLQAIRQLRPARGRRIAAVGVPLPALLAAVILAAPAVRAEDLVLKNGTRLQNAEILRADGASLVISHSGGISRVPRDQLPPDLAAQQLPAAAPPPAAVATAPGGGEKPVRHYLDLSTPQQQRALDQLIARYIVTKDGGLLELTGPDGTPTVEAESQGYVLIADEISRTLGGDEYLAAKDAVKLRVPGNNQLVAGEPVAGLAVRDGTYDFRPAPGDFRRLRAFQMVEAIRPTGQHFIDRMKKGASFVATLSTEVPCAACSGKGQLFTAQKVAGEMVICSHCAGQGKIEITEAAERDPKVRYYGPANPVTRRTIVCAHCGGSGQVQTSHTVNMPAACSTCGGKGAVMKDILVKLAW